MSDQQFYIALVAAITRGLVLVIAALAGMICIYLGWKLYRDSIASKTEGGITAGGMKVRLLSAGPGVFFVAFGAWLLVHVVEKDFTIGTAQSVAVLRQGAPDGPMDAGDSMWVKTVASAPGNPSSAAPAATSAPVATGTPHCVIAWRVTFWDGRQLPEPAEIDSALLIATNLLTASLRTDINAVAPQDPRLQALRTLGYLKLGITR